MSKSLLLLFVVLVAFQFHSALADRREECFDQVIKNAGDTVDVKLKKTFGDYSSCFELKQGVVYDITNEDPDEHMVEISTPDHSLSRWVRTSQLDRINPKSTAIKASFFRDIHAKKFESCFHVSPSVTYEAEDSHWAQGILMVKIRDTKSDLYTWFASGNLDLVDGNDALRCTTASVGSGGQNTSPGSKDSGGADGN